MGLKCYILHEVAKRMYCINYLVRSGVPTCDILCVYCSVIRSVLEYACAVWHPRLTKKLSQDIERVQKRCLKLLSYNQALNKFGLDRLDSRRDVITQKMFQEIKDQKHPLLPPVKVSNSQMVLWPTYPYQLPLSKSSRYGRDFIPYCMSKKF